MFSFVALKCAAFCGFLALPSEDFNKTTAWKYVIFNFKLLYIYIYIYVYIYIYTILYNIYILYDIYFIYIYIY